MFVRLFCHPNTTELGLFTRELVNLVMIDLGMSVRLLPPPPSFLDLESLTTEWSAYRDLFNTVIEGPYVNIVSSNDEDEWSRLWTTNVTNLLVTTKPPPTLHTQHLLRHGAYQAVIVPTSVDGGIYNAWHAARVDFKEMPAVVLPIPWALEHANAVRDLILV